jgi:hypothetical protein
MTAGDKIKAKINYNDLLGFICVMDEFSSLSKSLCFHKHPIAIIIHGRFSF